MRHLLICSAILIAGCGTYTSVVGPYRASLSRADVQSIVGISQTIYPGHYNQMTLNAAAPDVVWVDTQSRAGTFSYDYSAVRRDRMWKRGGFTPPPPLDD